MSNTPSGCPGHSDLRGFLEGASLEIDRRTVAAHVEKCAVCQSQLDRWTADVRASSGEGRSDLVAVTEKSSALSMGPNGLQAGPGPGAAGGVRTDMPESLAAETVAVPEVCEEGPTTPGATVIAFDDRAASELGGNGGRLGPYRLLERIGQGGMGVVLEALDQRLNRLVAIKMLAPGLADGALARQRFIREARAAAAVCHDHVVTIHAVDEFEGQPFIVMQLVAGQSLQQKLDRSGPLQFKEVVRIGMEIASGLAAAHAQGLVHRDIKPANILLENGIERVKITDFGLARAVDDASLTDSGTLLGTPNYMSPEQARGEPVDISTDLFSLGSVLYAACTGQPPFRADSTVAVLRKVSDDPPRPIRELNPDVPDWLVAIISKLMAKAPGERYRSATELSDVLAAHLADLKDPSRPSSSLVASPIARRPKSRRAIGVIASTLGLTATAIAFLSWWRFHPSDSSDLTGTRVSRPPDPPSRPDQPPAQASHEIVVAVSRDPVMSKTFFGLAREAATKGDQKRALGLYDEAIARDPENTAALLAPASILSAYAIANWSGAIADTTEAIRLDPKNAQAYELRARARGRSHAFRAAIDDATEAIRLDPGREEAYVVRGTAYNGLGEWNHAIVDLNAVIRRAPDWPWNWFERANAYFGSGEQDKALSDINRAIELDRKINQFWYLRGRIHGAKGDYKEAIAEVNEGIRLSPEPERFRGYHQRGEVESSFSKIDQAIADYSEVIRLRGNKIQRQDSALYTWRANLYLAHGETDLASKDLDLANRLDPRNSWVLYHRGLAHARKRMFDKAIADFEDGRKLSEGDKMWTGIFIHSRADCLAMAGRTDLALAGFKEAVALDPSRRGHPVLATHAWFIDRPNGNYDAALKKLDEAAKGGMIIQFLDRGLIYVRLEKPDAAIADFNEVIKRVKTRRDWFAIADYLPRWPALLIGRGEAFLLKGELDLALADSNEAVQFAPKSHEARLLRARIREKRGEKELANADRREAARLEPDFMLTLPKPRALTGASHR
jgi:serine/threonine protein kinase/lipoprotein NlpI